MLISVIPKIITTTPIFLLFSFLAFKPKYIAKIQNNIEIKAIALKINPITTEIMLNIPFVLPFIIHTRKTY